MIRTTRSGKVIEKAQYFVGARKPRADRRKGSSSRIKIENNMTQAVRNLARVFNCNVEKGDLLVTATYDETHYKQLLKSGDIAAAADKAFALFWRKVWRVLKALGHKIRGVWITADKDPRSGELVRVHHHMIIGSEGFELFWSGTGLESITLAGRDLEDIWGRGFINVEPVKAQDDYTALANYFVRQAVIGEDKKKWHSARGMKKPVIESEKIVESPHELRAPGGAEVQEIGSYNIETGAHYIRYIRKPKNRDMDPDPPTPPKWIPDASCLENKRDIFEPGDGWCL